MVHRHGYCRISSLGRLQKQRDSRWTLDKGHSRSRRSPALTSQGYSSSEGAGGTSHLAEGHSADLLFPFLRPLWQILLDFTR